METTEKSKNTSEKKKEVKKTKTGNPIHPLDALIENIKTDRELLKEQEIVMNDCKADKFEITQRLKGYNSDLKVFLKYATEKQKEEIEKLGLNTTSSHSHPVNHVVEISLKIMQEKKKLTNGELYDEYVKAVPKGHTPETYTFFNIKLRSLFNRQVLKKEKGKDSKSSKDDIIVLSETKT